MITWKQHRFLTHGWDHWVIVLDDRIVFRFPKDIPENLERELFDETRLLDSLKKRVKAGIPEYAYVSQDKSFAGYKIVSGRELKPAQYRRLTLSQKGEFAGQLADFLSALHQTPKSTAAKFNVRTENNREEHASLVRDIKHFLYPRLNKKEVRLI